MNPDMQSVGAGGVLGAVLLGLAQAALARFWPARPTPPGPAPEPVPIPVPTPALAPARPNLLGLLEALGLELLRLRLAGGEVPAPLKAAAPTLRQMLDQIDPPPPK